MIKLKWIQMGALLLCLFVIFLSCSQGQKNDIKVSENTGHSHHAGENCMNCHKQGGPGDGWFTAGGTAYDSISGKPAPNTTVYLYTRKYGQGILKYTLHGDGSGNFYTTENIDYSAGVYPAIQGPNGMRYMITSITMGQCNSCHGISTLKLFAY